ncbi:MAG: hypothetical protein KKH98_05055 [Spirochaetes bacterium]|nr:hypothetical protein [Spirochaetota bacterium]
MKGKKYYSMMFFIGALWNFSVAILFTFWHKTLFPFFGLQELNHPIVMQIGMAVVFALGIGYYMVSRDLTRNHGLILIAVIGKALIFGIFLLHVLLHNIPLILISIGAVDLIFAVLFLEFLLTVKRP